MISQEEWRAGLPDPDYERIPNTVHNVIIHHSAGSNSDTDYVSVVRNIYIYHTEVRGWSDIGYNYLIAQDGNIFKGRDPGTLQQDEVLGAHFCNANTGTMGICVLGDYTSLAPPVNALQSLIDLTTWKLGKDSLDPLGIYPHPLNANLPVIAGHRDGCATECPGDSLYQRLGYIRQEVSSAFENCGYSIKPLPVEPYQTQDIRLGYALREIVLHYDLTTPPLVKLFDMLGREVEIQYTLHSSNAAIISTENLKPGIYVLLVRSRRWVKPFKIQVY
jgi:hypothetical protein